ncbi:MAG: AAA family ATPase, partial [Actinobacteria bacterium]|nr:AAA family ATPase [Actinomycetota bacterium]
MQATAALLGRDTELSTLGTLLSEAWAGKGRAVLLTGEAGIGKTRLAEALADRAAADGFTVAWGRCPDSEAPPYWPWSQALGGLFGPDGRVVFEADHATRAGLFAAVAEALKVAAETTPAVVVLEDVHWADPSSLALLRFVIGVIPGLPVVFTLTARDDPLEQRDDVATALAGLPPAVLRLPLGGLDAEATAALVERIAGPAAAARLAADVHARTAGNPFFVSEVARLHAMRARDRTGATPFEVPPGVRQVLSRRLARIPQATSELLWAAAVIGQPDLDRLVAMTGRSAEDVLALLDDAVRARLVSASEDGFRFAHDLIRESLYEELSPTVRARLHRRAAEVLGDGHPADAAAHWARAAGGDARLRAASHALDAAEAAMAQMGYEQAARWYRRALDGGGGEPITVSRRLGEAQVLAGELTAGRDRLRQAAEAASRAGRGEDVARAVLAMGTSGFEVDITDASQVGLLDAALSLVPPGDSAVRAAALARRSLVRALSATPEARAAEAQAAVAMAGRVGDPMTEAIALAAVCDALAGPDHVAERLAAAGRMLTLAEASGDPLLVLLARRLRLVARLEQGDLAGVDTDIAAYSRTAEPLRLPLYSWPVPIWRGMRALLDSDVPAAWRFAAEAEALGRQAGSANAEMMVWALRMAAGRADGTTAQLVPVIETMLASADEFPSWHCVFAAVFAEAGQTDRARRHFDRAISGGGVDAIPKDSEWVEVVWHLGQAAMLLDEPEAARAVCQALHPYGHLWVVDGIGGSCLGPVAEQVARLDAFLAGRDRGTVGSAMPVSNAAVDTAEFHREGRLWHLRFRGRAATVPDSKGMADLAALLARPGREVHV